MLLLISDGIEQGSHHLIYLRWDDQASSFLQTRYDWEDGVPIDIDATFIDDITRVIITTTSQAVVLATEDQSLEPFDFGELVFSHRLDLGNGVGDINYSGDRLEAAFPDEGLILSLIHI